MYVKKNPHFTKARSAHNLHQSRRIEAMKELDCSYSITLNLKRVLYSWVLLCSLTDDDWGKDEVKAKQGEELDL